MAVTLMENRGLPPGGIVFHDPRIPSKVWKDDKTSLAERVHQVIEFRRQNPSIYDAEKDERFLNPVDVRNEITMFNYHRLGKNSAYFNVTDRPMAPIKNGCCGVTLEPRYCPTCIAKKIIGYKCPKCGREVGL